MSSPRIGAIAIHSKDYCERKKNIESLQNLFKNNDVEFTVIDGVFTDKKFFDIRYPGKFLTKGQIGVALAHLNALKLAIDKDYDYCYFFEDDVAAIVPNYVALKKWIDEIEYNHDLILLTNVGMCTGQGHDERIHTAHYIRPDLIQSTSPFSTGAYYTRKSIIKILFETQITAYLKDKLYIADGLPIHCEKQPGVFLTLLTPSNKDLLFSVDTGVISIVNKFS
jgi:hypothetical protein